MSEVVLDSSVMLAVIKGEAYHASTLDVLEGAVMSAVNFSEVWSKVYELKRGEFPAVRSVMDLLDRIEPFTASQAEIAAALRVPTVRAGLSLGDRACLALAKELDGTVFTAEQSWTTVETGCRVHLIR